MRSMSYDAYSCALARGEYHVCVICVLVCLWSGHFQQAAMRSSTVVVVAVVLLPSKRTRLGMDTINSTSMIHGTAGIPRLFLVSCRMFDELS